MKKPVAVTIGIGERLSGWVGANRRTILNSDPALDLGDYARRPGVSLNNTLSVPVLGGRDLLGVLSVYRDEPFSEADRARLETIARLFATRLAHQRNLSTTREQGNRPPVDALARGAVAAGGIYSGLVPKLLGPHKDELVLLAATGIGNTRTAAVAFGLAEVIFGLLVVVCWKARWPPSAEARCGGCGTAGSSRCRFWSSGLPAASYSPNRRKMFRLR